MEHEEDDCNILFSKSFIGSLIMEMNTMLRTVSVEADLSNVLDKYQDSLKKSQLLLSNGIVNINFAEAALFLQSASALYGKKVDLLWATTLDCRKRMIEFEAECRKRKEAAEIEETKKKHERRIVDDESRKAHALAIELKRQGKFWEKVNLHAASIQIKSTETDVTLNLNHTRNDKWKQINQHRKQSSLNVDLRDYCISEPDFLVDEGVTHDDELLTKLNELSMCQLLNTMSSDERHFKVKYLCQKLNQVSYFYENDLYLTQYLKQKKLKLSILGESNFDEYNEFVLKCQQEKNTNRAERITEITRGKSRISDAVSFTDSAFQERSFLSDSYPASVSSRRKSDSLFGEVNIPEEDDEGNMTEDSLLKDDMDGDHLYCTTEKETQDNIGETNNNVTENICCDSVCQTSENANRIFSECEIPCDTETVICESTTKQQKQQKETTTTLPELTLAERACKIIIERKRKLSPDRTEKNDTKKSRKEDEPNLRKRRRVNLRKLIKIVVTEKLGKFERFYFENYNRGDGESGVECDSDFYNDDDDGADTVPFDFEDEINTTLDLDDLEAQDNNPENTTQDIELLNSDKNDTERIPDTNDVQTNESTNLISYLQSADECNGLKEKSHTDVLQWQIFMRDKLKKIEQKSDFDIHSYSTKIIESIPLNESKKFTELTGDMSASEISKYFLATLSLACTNNVDVLGVQQGKVSNETLELKLLSKTRHHEELEHYLPPSDIIRQKFKKFQTASLASSCVSSTSNATTSTQSKHKRLKLS